LLQITLDPGEGKVEDAASIYFTPYTDLTTMGFNDLLHNGQSQAGATKSTCGRAIHLVEPIKNAGQLVRRDTNPGVLDFCPNPIAVRIDPYCDGASRIAEFDGVLQQVVENLGQAPLVALHLWKVLTYLFCEV
jgi:hypothetical protein